MYIHKNIIYQVIENPIQMCDSECLWIKIKNFDSKFTLGVVYRHPRTQTADQFLEDFSKCLDSLYKDFEYYNILGDFNITLEIEKNIPLSMRYLNILISYGGFPLITKPTRVTENSSSIKIISFPMILNILFCQEFLKHVMSVIITQSFAK